MRKVGLAKPADFSVRSFRAFRAGEFNDFGVTIPVSVD
jgi:hypothetical protein